MVAGAGHARRGRPAAARGEEPRRREPYEPGGFERAMNFVEEKAIFILDREGFYPKLGSLTTGSGFAYGLGFRDRDLFATKGRSTCGPPAALRRYWATEARLTFPKLWPTSGCSSRPGPPPRLSAGGLLRPRPRLGRATTIRLRHPIEPLRRPRRRPAGRPHRARRRRRRVSGPEARRGQGRPRART